MRSRFRNGNASVSFFAFQDIITAVTGIMVLITVFLSLSIRQGSSVTQPRVPSQIPTMTKELEELLTLLDKLRGEADTNADATLPSRNDFVALMESLKTEEGELRAYLASAEKDPTGPALRSAIAASETKAKADAQRYEKAIQKLTARSSALSGEIDSVGRAAEKAEAGLAQLKKQPRLNLLWTPAVGQKKPIIAVIQGDGVVLHFVDRKETEHLTDVSAFSRRVSGFDTASHQLAFYVRPTGTPFFKTYKQTARSLGFVTGDDAIPESFVMQLDTSQPSVP